MEDLTNIMDRVTSYSNNNDNKICIDSVIEYCDNIHTVRMYIDKKNIENSKAHKNPLDLKITRDKYKICVEIFNYHYHYTDLIYRVVNFHSRAERRSTNLQKIYLDNYHLHSLIEELFINESPTTLRNFWCQEYTFINKFFDLKLLKLKSQLEMSIRFLFNFVNLLNMTCMIRFDKILQTCSDLSKHYDKI